MATGLVVELAVRHPVGVAAGDEGEGTGTTGRRFEARREG